MDLIEICRTLLEPAPVPTAITAGRQHTLKYTNPAFALLLDRSVDHLLDHTYGESVPRSAADGSVAFLDRVFRTGRPEHAVQIDHSDAEGGTRRWILSAWPIGGDAAEAHDDGSRQGLVLQIEDRTGPDADAASGADARIRRINERLLLAILRERDVAERAGQRFAEVDALLGSLSDGVLIVDADGTVITINPAGQRLWGIPEGEELETLNDYDHCEIPLPDGKPLPPADWPTTRALRGERFSDVEILQVHADGTRSRLLWSGSAIRDDAGDVVLAILVFRDVTELRELERLREEYLSLISHDLKAPLNVILGHTELLWTTLERQAFRDQTGSLAAITKSVRGMNAMIDDLLETTRLEAGRLTMDRQPADLVRLIGDTVERTVEEDERFRIRIETAAEPPAVAVDRQRLERVLANIITNAIKYSPAGSPVTVRVDRPNDTELLVSVIDRGPGIAPDEQALLFERFFRAGTGSGTQGLGLGLYIARMIVQAHGGRIWVDTQPGQGSTFRFTLPLNG